MDIDELSIGITGSEEEQAFAKFVKENNLDLQLGKPFKLPNVFHHYVSIVGKQPTTNYVICQKALLRNSQYRNRFNKEKQRFLLNYKFILEHAIYKKKKEK